MIDTFRFTEGTSAIIEGDIVDQDGNPVELADLTGATLTYYDIDTADFDVSPVEGVINGRHEQDILNANDVGIEDESPTSPGHFRWDIQPEDTVIVTPRKQIERHRAVFLFEWTGGQFRYMCEVEIVNLLDVPNAA